MNKTFLNKQTEIPWLQIPYQDPGEPEGCSSGGDHGASTSESIPGAPRQSGSPANQRTGLSAWICVLGSRRNKFWVSAWHTTPTRWDTEILPVYLIEVSKAYTALLRDRLRPSRCCPHNHAAPRLLLYNPRQAQGAHDILALYFVQAGRLIVPSHEARLQTYCFEVWQIWVTSSS